MDSILQLLRRLQEEQVDFVLIGGLAAALHGSSIITQDLDICLRFTKENTVKLVNVLKDMEPKYRMTPQRKAMPLDPVELERFKNLYLATTAGQLDIRSEVDGLGNFEDVKKQSIELQVNNLPLKMLTIDAIIQSKSVLKRDKDRRSIAELMRLKQELQQHQNNS